MSEPPSNYSSRQNGVSYDICLMLIFFWSVLQKHWEVWGPIMIFFRRVQKGIFITYDHMSLLRKGTGPKMVSDCSKKLQWCFWNPVRQAYDVACKTSSITVLTQIFGKIFGFQNFRLVKIFMFRNLKILLDFRFKISMLGQICDHQYGIFVFGIQLLNKPLDFITRHRDWLYSSHSPPTTTHRPSSRSFFLWEI